MEGFGTGRGADLCWDGGGELEEVGRREAEGVSGVCWEDGVQKAMRAWVEGKL